MWRFWQRASMAYRDWNLPSRSPAESDLRSETDTPLAFLISQSANRRSATPWTNSHAYGLGGKARVQVRHFGLWTLDFRLWAAELIGWNPLSALPGNLGLQRQFAMYPGLGKGWRLASPRLPPLPGGRAGPLLGFPVAKRVKSGASKSVNSGN